MRIGGRKPSGSRLTSIGEVPVVVATRLTIGPARRCRVLGWSLAYAIAGLIAPPAPAVAEAVKGSRVEFNRDIRPILSENCFSCHGPDKNRRKAKLRLDERASAVAKEAIVPGKPDESELVARIFSDDAEEVMPPPSSHKTLTPAQKELLKAGSPRGPSISRTGRTSRRSARGPAGEARGMGPQPDRRVHPRHPGSQRDSARRPRPTGAP